MPKTIVGRVVLIHGANYSKHVRSNLCRFAPAFRAAGFTCLIPTYGYLPAIVAGLFPWLDNRIADALSGFIEPTDILVGHSNGATLIYLISRKVKIRGAVMLNAALDEFLVPNADFVHVYFNEDDRITKISSILPFSHWGGMGGRGYLGDDPRVRNIDQGNPPDNLPPLHGHSDVFNVNKCRAWGRYMAELCLQEVLKILTKVKP